MTLLQLNYLIEISKCSSISQAAKRLYVTQPNLSKAIKNLEDELGISIFHRSSQGIEFTKEGLELLYYATHVLKQVDCISQQFSNRAERPLQFTISSQHYAFAVAAFIQFLKETDAPNYELHFHEEKTSEVIEHVASQTSQLGILCISPKTERYLTNLLESKNLAFHVLKELTPYVFLRPSHPLASKTSIHIDDLRPYPCLSYTQGTDSLNFNEEILSIDTPSKTIYVTDRATMNNIIQHTDAYNIGTGCLYKDIISPEVISLPLQEDHPSIARLGWIARQDHILPDPLLEYVRLMGIHIDQCYFGNSHPE
jgi:DNA-binding transcriptional LysR family regulator